MAAPIEMEDETCPHCQKCEQLANATLDLIGELGASPEVAAVAFAAVVGSLAVETKDMRLLGICIERCAQILLDAEDLAKEADRE